MHGGTAQLTSSCGGGGGWHRCDVSKHCQAILACSPRQGAHTPHARWPRLATHVAAFVAAIPSHVVPVVAICEGKRCMRSERGRLVGARRQRGARGAQCNSPSCGSRTPFWHSSTWHTGEQPSPALVFPSSQPCLFRKRRVRSQGGGRGAQAAARRSDAHCVHSAAHLAHVQPVVPALLVVKEATRAV